VKAIKHGTKNTYQYHGCKCPDCTRANREANAAQVAAKLDERILVDGRWFAPNAAVHGSASTYRNRGCRCWPCTKANRQLWTEWAVRTGRRQP
jgi:hypothetical protein